MSNYLAISMILGLAAAPRVASADEGAAPARRARPELSVLVGLTIPDGLYVTGHDETIPLPALRVSWQVLPRVSLDVGGTYLPLQDHDAFALGHLGARWFAGEGSLGPYLLARIGLYNSYVGEGDDQLLRFAVAGGGIEYTHGSGFSVWAELALGGVSRIASAALGMDREVVLGIYGSAGFGYRFGR